MPHLALTPVFAGLRTSLHVLVAGLVVLVMVRAGDLSGNELIIVRTLAVVFAAIYAAGSLSKIRRHRMWWLLALGVCLLALMVLSIEAVYLVFPLFFLQMHLLAGWRGPLAVVVSVALAITMLGLHDGLEVGEIIGPTIGAGVAITIGLGYRALFREAAERELLIAELQAAQGRLASVEREKGVLDERSRLAAEIHDTVAQGLSSIQMFLHAAERAEAPAESLKNVKLARETASDSLAEARRLVRELAPAPLQDETLVAALRRLVERTGQAHGIDADVVVEGAPMSLAMPIESALLRLAQGVLGNVVEHAHCTHVRLTLSRLPGEVRMDIVDDGVGFDPDAVSGRGREADSFGFAVMAQRVERLGGTLAIESSPDNGTAVSVAFEVEE